MKTTCVFTGHRQLFDDFQEEKLDEAIANYIQEGVTTFYDGGAVGFDLLAAEKVLAYKEKLPFLKLLVCIPCEQQSKYFSATDKARYKKILSKADEVITLSEWYYRGCMQVRDRYMAERADCMIAYCKKTEGGTAYTVRYFQKIRPDGEIFYV